MLTELKTSSALAVKPVAGERPGIVTDTGTLNRGLVLDNETTVPPGSAAAANVTTQVAMSPGFKTVGLHSSATKAGPGGATASDTVKSESFRLAVKTTATVVEIAPAVTAKVPVAEPADTVRAAGTMTAGSLLESDTAEPLGRAGLFSVTVQVTLPPEIRLVLLHEKAVRTGGSVKVSEAVLVLLL